MSKRKRTGHQPTATQSQKQRDQATALRRIHDDHLHLQQQRMDESKTMNVDYQHQPPGQTGFLPWTKDPDPKEPGTEEPGPKRQRTGGGRKRKSKKKTKRRRKSKKKPKRRRKSKRKTKRRRRRKR